MGNKSKNLEKLEKIGFLVPKFIVLSQAQLKNIDNIDLEYIKNELNSERFIVRSDMQAEDSAISSFAGQFLSKINLSIDEIKDSINEVVKDAKDKGLSLEQIGIIIQKYINPDYSGITFTRNPNGNREIIIEYHKGIGEDIVSGKINPIKKAFYTDENIDLGIKTLNKQINNFINIEKYFAFPQDIEWCIKDNTFYYLQSRNITTISENEYRSILYLDDFSIINNNFLYEKNELSEICKRPTGFMLSLFEKIYSNNGPIYNFYKKIGVKYNYTDYLKIFGNEIYIDKEKELKSIFPSFTYLKGQNYKLSFSGFKGILKTISNFKNLVFIKKSNNRELYKKINDSISFDNKNITDLKQGLDIFLSDYENIFHINFLAMKKVKDLEIILKKENISLKSVLESNLCDFEEYKNYKDILEDDEIDYGGYIGNSIDILDDSEFTYKKIKSSNNLEIKNWLNGLKNWKKLYYEKLIFEALILQAFREKSRILAVKNMSLIRNILSIIAKMYEYNSNKYLINFNSIEDIMLGNVNTDKTKSTQATHYFFDNFDFPNRISKYYYEEKLKLLHISGKKAIGKLVNLENIENIEGDKILYVKILTPDLTKYFSKINGIISENGGYLSHFSIIARENNFPVISQVNLVDLKINILDMIEIDCTNGNVMIYKI